MAIAGQTIGSPPSVRMCSTRWADCSAGRAITMRSPASGPPVTPLGISPHALRDGRRNELVASLGEQSVGELRAKAFCARLRPIHRAAHQTSFLGTNEGIDRH